MTRSIQWAALPSALLTVGGRVAEDPRRLGVPPTREPQDTKADPGVQSHLLAPCLPLGAAQARALSKVWGPGLWAGLSQNMTTSPKKLEVPQRTAPTPPRGNPQTSRRIEGDQQKGREGAFSVNSPFC